LIPEHYLRSKEQEAARAREFESVALPHTERLLRVALRLVHNERAEAEDLVQEALLQAWRSFDQFEKGSNCKAWLFRILFNLSNRRLQKQKIRPTSVSTHVGELTNVVAMQIKPVQIAATEVCSALDALPAEQSTVVILAIVEGFTCKEVASMLGLPIGTVMSRLSRGREALRKILTGKRSNAS
jgi:RNA polymerase sigma-70 factor (ECF subfamily)